MNWFQCYRVHENFHGPFRYRIFELVSMARATCTTTKFPCTLLDKSFWINLNVTGYMEISMELFGNFECLNVMGNLWNFPQFLVETLFLSFGRIFTHFWARCALLNAKVCVIIGIFATQKWKNKGCYLRIVTFNGQVVRICKKRFEINQVRCRRCWSFKSM